VLITNGIQRFALGDCLCGGIPHILNTYTRLHHLIVMLIIVDRTVFVLLLNIEYSLQTIEEHSTALLIKIVSYMSNLILRFTIHLMSYLVYMLYEVMLYCTGAAWPTIIASLKTLI
jgi:uncharacterized membrane protein YesL